MNTRECMHIIQAHVSNCIELTVCLRYEDDPHQTSKQFYCINISLHLQITQVGNDDNEDSCKHAISEAIKFYLFIGFTSLYGSQIIFFLKTFLMWVSFLIILEATECYRHFCSILFWAR